MALPFEKRAVEMALKDKDGNDIAKTKTDTDAAIEALEEALAGISGFDGGLEFSYPGGPKIGTEEDTFRSGIFKVTKVTMGAGTEYLNSIVIIDVKASRINCFMYSADGRMFSGTTSDMSATTITLSTLSTGTKLYKHTITFDGGSYCKIEIITRRSTAYSSLSNLASDENFGIITAQYGTQYPSTVYVTNKLNNPNIQAIDPPSSAAGSISYAALNVTSSKAEVTVYLERISAAGAITAIEKTPHTLGAISYDSISIL